MVTARSRSLSMAVLAAVGAGGCGDNLAPRSVDGGSEQSSLVVLDPPGESIGLDFHARATLSVRYVGPDGGPIAGAPVGFSLVTSASEATGGSTVSDTEVATDDDGVAGVDLVAGGERVNFRVQATAPGAPPALFYVTVSQGGFTDLVVTPAHVGYRAEAALGAVEVRLYRGAAAGCDDLSADDPPESVFPPRSLPGFGGEAVFRNVAAGEPYSLLAWAALSPGGRPIAQGCVELGPDQLRAAGQARLPLPVVDRSPELAGRIAIESVLDMTPLAGAIAAAGPDPWVSLACPLGPAQLVIDCALDAAAPDGALDCEATGDSPLAAEVQALRGLPDADGCRPGSLGPADSLDARVAAALAPPWSDPDLVAGLVAARRAPLEAVALRSSLEPLTGGAGVVHRLERLAVETARGAASVDLVASNRPIVRQVAPAAVTASGQLVVDRHGFTADYGRFAQGVFAELGLLPAGLAGQDGALGQSLHGAVTDEDGAGCPALSRRVCGEIARAGGCLAEACAEGSAALDSLLEAWWQLFDGPGLDLSLAGSAALADPDGDLELDGLGQEGEPGAWNARLRLSTGQNVALDGTWTGARP